VPRAFSGMMRGVLPPKEKEPRSMKRINRQSCASVVFALVVPFLGAVSGCSSSEGGGGDGLSCDVNKSPDTHICVLSSGYGKTPGDSDATKANCAAAGGTEGTSCNLTGAVAGCRGMGAGESSYVTITYWYYSGTVDSVSHICQAAGQTLVTPGGAVAPGPDAGDASPAASDAAKGADGGVVAPDAAPVLPTGSVAGDGAVD
jgi:hypothetical protein